MSPPDDTMLDTFEQLCHEVSNPLMVVSGHAHLLERYVLRLRNISDVERKQLLDELGSIKGNVQDAVLLMDRERWRLTDEDIPCQCTPQVER
jgi:nitrogen-specific signal transduction histidine kinase